MTVPVHTLLDSTTLLISLFFPKFTGPSFNVHDIIVDGGKWLEVDPTKRGNIY